MNDGIDDSPEYVLIYKPLLEQGIVKEVFDLENVIKGLEYYLSIIENEKDREKLKPLIEKAISDDVVDDALDKILTLFPDSKCPIPVLVEIIKDCAVYSVIHRLPKNGQSRMPNTGETKEHLDKIISSGKKFVEKIEALHPENWTTIAYLDPSTGTGVLSEEDFKDWDDFLETAKMFLDKAESIKKRISARGMKGRVSKDDKADKENAYLKAFEICTMLMGSASEDQEEATGQGRGVKKKKPSVTKPTYMTDTNPKVKTSGRFVSLMKIIFSGVFENGEISTFDRKKTGRKLTDYNN